MSNRFLIVFLLVFNLFYAKDIYVSNSGNDNGQGTQKSPYKTFVRALVDVKQSAAKEAVTVWFNQGTYYLDSTIKLTRDYSGTSKYPVVFSAIAGAKVEIKGSKRLDHLQWKPMENGMFVAKLSQGLNFDQLFINGERQIRVRFPNYDYENPLRGGKGYLQVTDGTNKRYDKWFTYEPETFSKKEWKHAETGIVHAFQSHNWGNMQYRIKEINPTEHKVLLDEGGWQLQRNYGIGGKEDKGSWYFIENIFEELDVAQEWFYDTKTNLLYYHPENGMNLAQATVEIPVLNDLIQIVGSAENPVKHIQFKGIHFTQSNYTFMDAYEPVARGDWAIHRGGAVFLEGTENCVIEDCSFDYLGGNGVFMSAYNRDNVVRNCTFTHTGESAVCFVGSPSAVRFYQTWDDKEIDGKDWEKMRENMDVRPGPKNPNYPKNCVVENSIMHDFGDVGKQVAGVYISMSHKIRVSHNTIYNCPRAGICINDGTWGGHVIEYNDIWETVRETGEHGPFNAWGRERQWKGSRGSDSDFIKEYTKLDAIDNVIVRNNRIANYRKSISAGNWTIDLDDGSSYYEIYNNLNLGSTIKLRDGMARKVYNNITVSSVPLGWHVWPTDSEDEIYKNIFVIAGALPGKQEATNNFIRPVALPTESKWSTNYDKNLYWNINYPDNFFMTDKWQMKDWNKEGYDLNSVVANPDFVDPLHGNYQVKENSAALKLGFKNFPMDEFGHQMTRILPFGGEFEKETTVSLKADMRAEKGAEIYYSLDGSAPTKRSLRYSKPFKVSNTLEVKAQTFDSDGFPVGFAAEVTFKKVEKVIYPSWLSTLLAGKYESATSKKPTKALAKEVAGVMLVNIADDPDLIDATGGYNFGCYIQSIDSVKGKIWFTAKLDKDWVIQQVNGNKIQNIADLEKNMEKYRGQKVIITAFRDYNSKKFEVQFP